MKIWKITIEKYIDIIISGRKIMKMITNGNKKENDHQWPVGTWIQLGRAALLGEAGNSSVETMLM